MEVQALLEKYGVVGAVAVGLFLLVHRILVWMQARIDAKDAALQQQHEKQIEMSQAVIGLANDTATRTATALDALTDEIRGMSRGVCERLERIEEQRRGP